MQIGLNDLKTVISISIMTIKNGQLWKRTNCGRMEKSCGKQWKILRSIYIVLIFPYC